MATTKNISIVDNATPALRAKIESLGIANVSNRVGRGVTNLFKAHLFKLNSERPNRLGGKRTNFYSQAAKLTSYQPTGQGVTVTVAQVGMRQRLFGGEIRAVNGKYLTIPARAEAYGRSARSFDNLRFVIFASGTAALVEQNVKYKRKNAKGAYKSGGGVMFWLKESVNQSADSSVIPSDKEILDAAAKEIESL